MIKRVLLLFAMALAMGGMVWAQVISPPDASEQTPPVTRPPSVPDLSPGRPLPALPWSGAGHFGTVNLNAVPSLSTESRFSAGIFSADADSFINPRRFAGVDAETFFFVGGNFRTEDAPATADRGVRFWFGRNFGPFWLAAYYGGFVVDGEGRRYEADPVAGLPYTNMRSATWDSNLALLFGLGSMGFRFDMIVDSQTRRSDVDYSNTDGNFSAYERLRRVENGLSLALTWGADLGFILPWARVGYRFADLYEREVGAMDFGTEDRFTANAALEISAGATIPLSETSELGFSLTFGNTFPEREVATGTAEIGIDETPERSFENRRFGMQGFGLGVYYWRSFEAGVMEFGFSPNVNAGLTFRSNDWSGDTIEWAQPGDRWFTLDGGVDLGVAVRPTERLSFFVGANVQFFDWTTWAQTRGDDMNPARGSAWRFDGAQINELAFGMTFAPTEAVTVGLGLTDLLNSGFFMRHVPGFDITVSIRANGNGNGNGNNGNGNGAAAAPPPPQPVAPVAPVAPPPVETGDDEGGIGE